MWNKFDSCSNEDESIGSSFLINGLFQVSNEAQSTKIVPNINAAVLNERFIIGIDKNLLLIKSSDSLDCQSLDFECEISCFQFSRTNEVIICCLSDGNIHGYHISGVPLFVTNIQEEDVSKANSFVSIIDYNDEFKVLCKNGTIYTLRGLDIKLINNDMLNNPNISDSLVNNESFTKSIELIRTSSVSIPDELHSFCCTELFEEETFIVAGSRNIYFITGDIIDQFEFTGIQKLSKSENYIIGLREDQTLVHICPITKTSSSFEICKNIVDLRIFDEDESHMELLLLLSSDNNQRKLQIVDFPSMTNRCEIKAPETAWLVNQKKSSANMFILSGLKNEHGNVQTVEFKCITETDPTERYRSLITRNLFAEAERFALEYDLNLEPLKQAKLLAHITMLQYKTNHTDSFEEVFTGIIKDLEMIEDKNFLCSLYKCEIPDRTCMTKFLKYLLSNIDTNIHEKETNEINELLLRLETLRLTDPEECNSRWQKFLHHGDLAVVAMDSFKSDVLQSSLIWSRHSSSILSKMNLDKFEKWVSRISTSTEPFQLVQWMKHFLPSFLQAYPQELNFIVDWSIERTRSFQFSHSWPDIGLEFLSNVQEILRDVKFIFAMNRLYHCNIEKIQSLVFTLEELAALKKSFHLVVTLDDYKQSSLAENALYLLQRVQMKDLKRLVNDFIFPLFCERGLSPENTIFEYVRFLCKNRSLGFWQERAMIAIDLISNEEQQLQAALMVLKVSSVPWSETILPLAKFGITSSNPLAKAIFIEYKTQAIKIIKLKYDFPVHLMDLQQDRNKLVFRILKVANDDMVDDLKTLVNSSGEIANEAYFHLILKLLQVNRIDELMDLVVYIENNLEDHKSFFEVIIDTLIELIDDADNEDLEFQENVSELLKTIVNRIEWHDFCEMKYREKISDFINVLKMKKKFKVPIRMNNFSSKENKISLFHACADEIISKLSGRIAVSKIIDESFFLSFTLKQNIAYGLKVFCEKLNNLFFSCKVAERYLNIVEVMDKTEVADVLELASLMLTQQIDFFDNNIQEGFPTYDPLVFPIAYELLIRCLPNCDVTQHDSVVGIITWTRIPRSYYSTDILEISNPERLKNDVVITENNKKKVNGHKRESFSVFEDINFATQTNSNVNDSTTNSVLRCVSNAIKLLSGLSKSNDFIMKFLQHKVKIAPELLQNTKNDFFKSLEGLLKLKEYNPVLNILQHVLIFQEREKLLIVPPSFVTTVNKKIIKFILSQKEPDYMDAFRVLRSEKNREDVIDYLRSSLVNNSQKIAFSTFLEMHNKFIGNAMSSNDERENRLKFYYYAELCKYDSTLRSKINFDTIGINDLLKDLQTRQLSVELVKKLSKDFSWEYQKALIQQLKIVLRNQPLEFEVKQDVLFTGREEITISTTEDEIRKKCAPYINEINDYHLLAQEMQSFIKEINFYFYEMYLYVLELISCYQELGHDLKVHQSILNQLKMTMIERRRGIEQIEVDSWMKYQPENSVLPAISKYRVAFKPLMERGDPEDFISSDLRVENFKKFIPLIKLHAELSGTEGDDRLEVCAFKAVKNSVMDMKAKLELSNGSEWNLKSSNNSALQAIIRMVSYIKDKSKRLAILYFHVNHSLPGSDQVEAAYECWKFATENENEIAQSQKYGDLVGRIRRKYPVLRTQHLLHSYNLADDKLIQLVEYPEDLIIALYQHESILTSQKKDINKLCHELADLFGVHLESIQHKLLQKWLIFSTNSNGERMDTTDGNETIYEDFMGSSMETEFEEPRDENVIRAHYILNSWDKNRAMSFLGSELSSQAGNTDNQLQIYECFVKLIDKGSDSFADLINSDDFLMIKCCSFLKQLGFIITSEKFKEIDKIELLKKVWKSHYNNRKGLEAMAFICVGFNIFTPKIWNGILKQMVALKMIFNISTLVEILSTKSELLHLDSLKAAWECIIKEPFLNANKNRTTDENKLAKSLVILQKCPISTFLNFESLIEICMRLERPHMAAVFLAYINESERCKFIPLFANLNAALQHELIELEEFGVAPVITKSVCRILNL